MAKLSKHQLAKHDFEVKEFVKRPVFREGYTTPLVSRKLSAILVDTDTVVFADRSKTRKARSSSLLCARARVASTPGLL